MFDNIWLQGCMHTKLQHANSWLQNYSGSQYELFQRWLRKEAGCILLQRAWETICLDGINNLRTKVKRRDCNVESIWSCTKLTKIAVSWRAVLIKITINWITQMKGSLSIFASDLFCDIIETKWNWTRRCFPKFLLFYNTLSLLATLNRKTFNARDSCWCPVFAQGDTPELLQWRLAPVFVYRRVNVRMVLHFS